MNTSLKWLATGLGLSLLVACQSAPPAKPSASAEPVKPVPVAEVTQTVNEKAKAGLLAPMIERRDTLVATGYAVISVQNHKNQAQQRLLAIRAAKLDAYRALTEQVYGQHLDATTTIADMTVMSDTFRTRVEGVVYGAVLVSITPAGDDTYEATLSLDRSVVNDLRALYLGQLVSSR
jgi:outer membrane protein FlgP